MVYNRNDYLSTSPWLKSQFLGGTLLNNEDIDFIKQIGDKKQFVKGAVMLQIGSRGENMFFIHQGTVRYTLLSPEGVEKPVIYVTPGGFVGEEAFFHKQPILYDAVAMEFTEATIINQRNYWDMVSRPGVAHIMLKSMGIKSRIMATQIEDLAFRTTVEKVARLLYCLLAENAGVKAATNNLSVTQQELASLAGAHRVSTTNAITQLKKEGLISVNSDGTVTVEDIKKLRIKGFGE
ncbi:Crp/Fnr family transcriptional regulator [Peptococcaceae bacterium 1198_IL3148]